MTTSGCLMQAAKRSDARPKMQRATDCIRGDCKSETGTRDLREITQETLSQNSLLFSAHHVCSSVHHSDSERHRLLVSENGPWCRRIRGSSCQSKRFHSETTLRANEGLHMMNMVFSAHSACAAERPVQCDLYDSCLQNVKLLNL